jgi:hypothetical protein
VAGTPDFRRNSLALAPLLSHDHGKAPASRHVVRKPDPQTGAGRRIESQPAGTSQRYVLTHFHPGQARTVLPQVSIRRIFLAKSQAPQNTERDVRNSVTRIRNADPSTRLAGRLAKGERPCAPILASAMWGGARGPVSTAPRVGRCRAGGVLPGAGLRPAWSPGCASGGVRGGGGACRPARRSAVSASAAPACIWNCDGAGWCGRGRGRLGVSQARGVSLRAGLSSSGNRPRVE